MAEGKKIERKGRILEASQSVWRTRVIEFANGLTLNIVPMIQELSTPDFTPRRNKMDGGIRAIGVIAGVITLTILSGIPLVFFAAFAVMSVAAAVEAGTRLLKIKKLYTPIRTA